MAKTKQESKKRGKIRLVFGWLGLGVLGILLILALVFQAPWKVTTLLVILIVACTILPKRYRKWFWLTTGGIVIALIIWVFLPENDQGWRSYTFDEDKTALESKYVMPDEENAAEIYDSLLRGNDPNTYYPDFLDSNNDRFTRSEPWSSGEYPELSKWLESHQGTIAELIQASRKGKCYFPIPAVSLDFNGYVERLAPMRRLVFLLLYAANNDIAEGRINAGIEKYLCIIRMADHMNQQTTQIYQVLSFAFERWSLSLLNRFVIEEHPTTEQLQRISNSIRGPENNLGSDLKRILEYDRLVAKNRFCSLAYEINQKGEVRFNRNHWRAAVGAVYSDIPAPTYSQIKLNKAKTIFYWFIYPSSPRKAAEILDICLDKNYEMAELDFDWTKEPPQLPFSIFALSKFRRDHLSYKYYAQLTAVMSENSYYNYHDMYLRCLTLRRGSRLLIAIKRYKIDNCTWPESLEVIKSAAPAEAFIDPITGNQLQYENDGESFSLFTETVKIWPQN